MKKALVTGSLGFVGGYLRKELEENEYEVVGIDVREGDKTIVLDLLDADAVAEIIKQENPDIIIHLAGQANVGLSWKIPQKTVEINVVAALNLMEAVRAFKPEIRMVLVGSSDQYGNLGALGTNVTENIEMHPTTPYAVSKLAQEEMAKVYVNAYGMNICMTRSFNHCGAGQREGFVFSDFASSVVRVEKGLANNVTCGNLSSKRDFTHVKDIVRAYRLIAEKGVTGEIYNVGSGKTYSAQDILNGFISRSTGKIEVIQDPLKFRPSDTPVICCNHSKLTAHTGWEPIIDLDTALAEVLEYYRKAND